MLLASFFDNPLSPQAYDGFIWFFVGLLVFFHWLLVYQWKLSARDWKYVDYIWLASAAFGLFTLRDGARKGLAEHEMPKMKEVIDMRTPWHPQYAGKLIQLHCGKSVWEDGTDADTLGQGAICAWLRAVEEVRVDTFIPDLWTQLLQRHPVPKSGNWILLNDVNSLEADIRFTTQFEKDYLEHRAHTEPVKPSFYTSISAHSCSHLPWHCDLQRSRVRSSRDLSGSYRHVAEPIAQRPLRKGTRIRHINEFVDRVSDPRQRATHRRETLWRSQIA